MRYRILAPIFDGSSRHEAGEIVDMPDSFVPSGACEPLDVEAVAAFHRVGPQIAPLIRMQWDNLPMSTYPRTVWKRVDPKDSTMWKLTGLGSALPAVKWTSDADRLNSLP